MEARDGAWNLPQVLDRLTISQPGCTPLFKDQRSALRALIDTLVAKKVRVYGRCCAWNDGCLVRENESGLISPEWLGNAEFISGPKGEGWFLVPWGRKPFAKPKLKSVVSRPGSPHSPGTATARSKHDQFGNCVAVPLGQIEGFCELQFQRDEVIALWPTQGATSNPKAKPGPKPAKSRDDAIRNLLRDKASRTPLKTFADKVRTACDAKESTGGFSDERISRRARQVERELQTEIDGE